MSPSVGHRSPMRRENLSKSPVRARSSRRSPKSDRERSPHRSSHRDRGRVRVSPPPTKEREKEKPSSSSRGRSPKRPRSISPAVVRDRHRSREEHHKDRHREREVSIDRSSERRLARVKKEEDSLSMRSRSMRSASPMDRHREREVSGDRSSERRPTRVKKEEDSLSLRSRSKRSTSPMDRHREREVSVDRSSERRPARVKKEEDSSSLRSRSKRSTSPMDRDHSIRPTSGSPSRNSRSRGSRDEVASPRGDEHRDEKDSVAMMKAAEEALVAKKKLVGDLSPQHRGTTLTFTTIREEPSFELSGKLAAETNRVRGVTLLFNEPPDARKPDIRWRLYVFKAGEVLNEPLYIHRQTCYLFGRERRVADIPTDHPSCSKQHAVIQFRQVEKEQLDGMLAKQVRPYLMDLGSTNGTFLNENRIESQRYYELFEKDTIKFGNSSREYVVLHENSAA